MTLFHGPSVQSPAAYSNQNLAGNQLAVRLAGTASAAQRVNLNTAHQDVGYRYKIHAAETAAGLIDTDLFFGFDPGDTRRYKAAIDGVTDDTTAYNRSLLVAYQGLGVQAYWPQGTAVITTLNITAACRIRTDGYKTILQQKSGLGDVAIINVQASNVTIGQLSAVGNIATDANEFHHVVAVGIVGTAISHVTVEGLRGTNIRGDVCYVGADATGPVSDVRIGQLDGTNILRNILSVTGGAGVEVDSIAGTQIGYHLWDVEPNAGSQSPTGVRIKYSRGGSVQVAGGALVGIGVGSVQCDVLDLDNTLQINSTPGYFKFATQAGNIGLIVGDVASLRIGYLKARNFQERLYNSNANTFKQLCVIDCVDIASSNTTEAVFKTLFNLDAFVDFRINAGVIALTAVDRYVVKGNAGPIVLNGLRISGGPIATQNTNGRFTALTIDASGLAATLFANCIGCLFENILCTNVGAATLLLNSTGNTFDTVKESGSVFATGEGAGCSDNQVRHSTIAGISYAYDRFSGQIPIIAMADANQTLTSLQAAAVTGITTTGALTAQRNLVVPSIVRQYTIFNSCTGFGVQVIAATGTGIVVGVAKRAMVVWDGVNMQRVTPDT